MTIDAIVVGPIQVNCYLIACDDTRDAVVIDPGDDASRILQRITAQKLTLRRILLTHGHFDHFGAAAELKAATGAAICAHHADLSLIVDAPAHAALFGLPAPKPFEIDRFVAEGDEITWGRLCAQVLETPGHSPGSVSFLLDKEVFVGDVLFSRSIGRTDLFGGSYEQLLRSIRDKLLVLDDDVRVHSGHGPPTTIGRERKYNPFLI